MKRMQSSLPLIFRCWHHIHGRMYDVVEIHNSVPTILSRPSSMPSRPEMIMMSKEEAQHLTVMAASPYQDKMGRWIYEGDVVQAERGEWGGRGGLVQFEDGCFSVLFDPENLESDVLMFEAVEYGLTVVGVRHFAMMTEA